MCNDLVLKREILLIWPPLSDGWSWTRTAVDMCFDLFGRSCYWHARLPFPPFLPLSNTNLLPGFLEFFAPCVICGFLLAFWYLYLLVGRPTPKILSVVFLIHSL